MQGTVLESVVKTLYLTLGPVVHHFVEHDVWVIFLSWPQDLSNVRFELFILADTTYIRMFVLDEADEMLSRGFKDQIYEVFTQLKHDNLQVNIIAHHAATLVVLSD